MDPSGAGAGALRRKAEQWLSVAEKLLVARDLEGCKQFASQALASDPHTPGADDLHAAAAALLAAQRRRRPNGQPDPYGVLGLDPTNPASRHPDAIHAQYRSLSFLLNRSRPDRPCSLAFAEAARLVADAWAFLSDPARKSALDAELHAAAAAAARAYHSPAPNLPQPHSQSPLPSRPTPPTAAPSPRPTPPPAAPSPRPTPPPAAPSPRPTPPPAAPTQRPTQPLATPSPRPTPPPVSPPLRRTPPPVASPPRPTQRSVAPQTRPAPLTAAPAPRPSPPPPIALQTQPSPPLPSTPQTPIAATVSAVQSGAAPSSTFWTVCACCHIHQYDRQYETRKLLCPSCRQTFVAEAMADPPPIVPGTDMYYCTWGFFPVGFPGCPGFERMINSQPRGPDQLNAPWLGGTGGVKGNTQDNAQNGAPPVIATVVEVPVEVPAVTPPAKPMRVKVGAKKRGRPKGSKNKKKL
ncbi:hypothetical protein PAHAL_2G294200 [Panicum hallii]|uniref:J domain-containing protein n=1 Tax=Panicum hallii TaxID=206008 RepID=A0A2S3H0A0_9POAL|nr:pollen-specific leucine-rich repeat extensin-like protein 2 [Panicum hallii]PAN12838.1 hypothetical protein PAHAL_2G294200 [Panicum hallii]